MKRLVAFICSTLLVLGVFQMPAVSGSGEPASYNWGSVPVGAGGFVTGLAAHPAEPNLIYCRTDVGGAYRWDENGQRWIPLNDDLGVNDSNLFGIDGIAIAPSNPDYVYLAAGKYAGNPGAVLKSTNRGESWTTCNLSNISFNGNGGNRGMGECIAVDPANENIVIVGTYNNGLYKTINGGASWEKLTIYTPSEPPKPVTGLTRTVAFDPSSSVDGHTPVVYVTLVGMGLYKSIDGGDSWSAVSGAPSTIKRLAIDPTGLLYAASTEGLKTWNGTAWNDISPQWGTYNGISIDASNPKHLVCVGPHTDENTMNIPIWDSTDGGATWNSRRGNLEITLPWAVNTSAREDWSSNTHDIVLDPSNPNRAWFCDFSGVHRTDNLSSSSPSWRHTYQGMEEVVPRNFICPPEGAYRLIAGIADVDGMVYTNYKEYPQRQLQQIRQENGEPWLMSSSSLDYCQEDPNIVVRVGIDWNSQAKAAISMDNTLTWRNITFTKKNSPGETYPITQFGLVAVSATKHPETGVPSIVVIPELGRPLVSLDLGYTWEEVQGITDTSIVTDYWDKGLHLASDKVNGAKFYIQDRQRGNSKIYVSEDWGKTWTNTTSLRGDWNQDRTYIKAAPYLEGEVWSCTLGNGLFRSSDGGKSFQSIQGVSDIYGFGFGKNAPDRNNPTVFLYGQVNGVMGMYRSIDMGQSWQRINDDRTPIGCSPKQVEGDMRTFGVVYVGTDGRGIWYGEPAGTPMVESARQYVEGFRTDDSLKGYTFYQNGKQTESNGYTIRSRSLANRWKDNTTSGQRDNIYTAQSWSGKYVFGARISNNGANDGNVVRMYFNYQDPSNYYCLNFPGGTSKPTLLKVERGEQTVLATAKQHLSVLSPTDIQVYYNGGTITVYAKQNAQWLPLLKGEDAAFSSGYIGFGSLSTEARVAYPYGVQSETLRIPEFPEPEPLKAIAYHETFETPPVGDWNLNAGPTAMQFSDGETKGIQGNWGGYHSIALLTAHVPQAGYRFSVDLSQAYGSGVSNVSRIIFHHAGSNYYSVNFQGGGEDQQPKVTLCKTVDGMEDIVIAQYDSVFPIQTDGSNMKHRVILSCEKTGEITVDFVHANGTTTRLFDRVTDTVTSYGGTPLPVWSSGQVGVGSKSNSTLFNNITLEQSPVMVAGISKITPTADGIQVDTTISNNFEGERQGVVLITAKYQDGTLADCASVPFALFEGEATGTAATLKLSGTLSHYTIQCYVWDGLDTIVPLALSQVALELQ